MADGVVAYGIVGRVRLCKEIKCAWGADDGLMVVGLL